MARWHDLPQSIIANGLNGHRAWSTRAQGVSTGQGSREAEKFAKTRHFFARFAPSREMVWGFVPTEHPGFRRLSPQRFSSAISAASC